MENRSTPLYSVIIPVFNSNLVLIELRQRIHNVFSSDLKQSFEIILVDDGSSNPATWPRISELVAQNEEVHGIQLQKNYGQHAALICGLSNAKGDYLITMDDDLQQSPEDIPQLIQLRQHDVVMGQFRRRKHSTLRNMGSFVKAYFDLFISGKPKRLRVSSFCLIRKSIAEKILANLGTPMPLFSSLLFSATRDIVGVEVSHSARQEGKSGYSMFVLTAMFFRILNNKSSRSVERQLPFAIRRRINKHQNMI